MGLEDKATLVCLYTARNMSVAVTGRFGVAAIIAQCMPPEESHRLVANLTRWHDAISADSLHVTHMIEHHARGNKGGRCPQSAAELLALACDPGQLRMHSHTLWGLAGMLYYPPPESIDLADQAAGGQPKKAGRPRKEEPPDAPRPNKKEKVRGKTLNPLYHLPSRDMACAALNVKPCFGLSLSLCQDDRLRIGGLSPCRISRLL